MKKIILILSLIMILFSYSVFASLSDYDSIMYFPFENDLNDTATENDTSVNNFDLEGLNGAPEGYVTGVSEILGNAVSLERDLSHSLKNFTVSGTEMAKIRTIDCWFKSETIGFDQRIITIKKDSSNMFHIYVENDGDIRIEYNNGGYTDVVSQKQPLQPGVWVHTVFTMDGSDFKIYIDGGLNQTDSTTYTIPNDYNQLSLGIDQTDSTGFYDGAIDNCFFTDSVYTQADVTESWNDGDGYNFSAVEEDTTPPYWTNNDTNFTTIATNENGQFNITFTDADSNLDSIIFSRKEYGESWINETISNIGALTYTASFPYTITSVRGETFEWKFYGNDVNGYGNVTTIWSLTVANAEPIATLISPEDISYERNNFSYHYKVSDADGIGDVDYCELWKDEGSGFSLYDNNSEISTDNYVLEVVGEDDVRDVEWYVKCYDSLNDIGQSDQWIVYIDSKNPIPHFNYPKNDNSTIQSYSSNIFFFNVSVENDHLHYVNLVIDNPNNYQVHNNYSGEIGDEAGIEHYKMDYQIDKSNWISGVYTVYVNATDWAENFKEWTRTFNISHPPTVDSVDIFPEVAYTNDILNCSFVVSDIEEISIKANVTWYKDSIYFKEETEINCVNGTLCYTLDPIVPANTNKNQEWNCSVIGYDSYDFSSFNSAIKTIQNTKPEVKNAIVSSTSPYNGGDGNLTANYTFYDIDATDVEVSYETEWYKDNNYLSEFDDLKIIDSSNVARDDIWFYSIRVSDGEAWSNWVNSSSILIENAPPTHTTPVLNSSFGTDYTNENLTCYNQSTIDGDGDDVVNLYNWYKNSNPLNDLYLPFEINVNDYSGNSQTTNNNNSVISSGKIGNSAEFNTTNYVKVDDSNSLDFTDEKTWELWFKRDTTGKETLFDKTNSNNLTNYKLYFDESNYLVFMYSIPGVAAGDFSWIISSEAEFNQGNYSDTEYSVDSVRLLAGKSSGEYNSTIFDATALSSWNNISWTEEIPYNEELPDNKGSDKGADMSGNILLLHLNEASGTVSDSSGEGNDGTVNGNLTYNVNGKFNTALDFDGTEDYITTSTTNFPTGNENITIEAWFKIDDLNSDNSIVTYGSGNGHNAIQLFHRTSDDKLILHYWGGYGAASTSLTDNNWHHAVGIHSNNTNYLYLDGALIGSTGYAFANIINNFNDIGRVVGISSYDFDGIIDEVAIYDRALSSTEILNHYKRGILKLNISLRDCNDANCAEDSFDIICTDTPCDISSLSDSRYLQYKAEFFTEDTSYTPKLFNTTIHYTKYSAGMNEVSLTSSSQITDTNWHYTAITFDDSITTDNFNLYLDNVLEATVTNHNTSQYYDNDLFIGRDYNGLNYFDGFIDEFRIYSNALSGEQIRNNYLLDYNKIISTETTRSDTWKCEVTPNDGIDDGITLDASLTIQNYAPTTPSLLTPADLTILGSFPTFTWSTSTDIDPEDTINYYILFDNNNDFSSIEYSASTETTSDDPIDGVALPNNIIDKYYWKVLASDGIVNTSSGIRSFNYSQWNITFNVTSGEDGSYLDNVNISSCTYSEFNQAGDTTNMYGPYYFPSGEWICTFIKDYYYDRTKTFTADNNKIVHVKLSEKKSLTIEEHTWLEALYNCIILKQCDLYDLLVQINTTVTNVWEHTKPTDPNVVTSENLISDTANSTHNVSYDYTINIPNKAGYAVNTYLPIRIGYWFINKDTGQCYSQGDYPSGIELVEPYCQPLMIETIGPMGGSVSFRVDIRPSGLTAGTYNITRSVEIDPNNIWNNYGQESIGEIIITEDLPENNEAITTQTTGVNEVKTTEVIIQQSGGGGSSPRVTNVYNIYNIEESEEEGEKEESKKEEKKETPKKSSLAEITGYTIGKFIERLSDGSPLIGFLIITIIVIGGLMVYTIVKKKY